MSSHYLHISGICSVSEEGLLKVLMVCILSLFFHSIFLSDDDDSILKAAAEWKEAAFSLGVWPHAKGKDLLVATSEAAKVSFLTFVEETKRFLLVNEIALKKQEKNFKEAGCLLAVDPLSRAIAVGAYDGLISVFLADNVWFGKELQMPIQGPFWEIAFLYPSILEPQQVLLAALSYE